MFQNQYGQIKISRRKTSKKLDEIGLKPNARGKEKCHA